MLVDPQHVLVDADPTEVCSEQEQDLKVEELDNTTDDNNHKTNKSWTEALDEGFAALPMYNCHKARLDIKEHNDPEWMLNAATAELQCLHAEDLCRDGKGFEALRVINKVSCK